MAKNIRTAVPFWDKIIVVENGSCWEWTHFINGSNGYGQCKYKGEFYRAHRLAYMMFYGPIPKDNVIRHSCDNPSCCNPMHLSRGTQKDNAQDAVRKNRNVKGEKHGNSKLKEKEVISIFFDDRKSKHIAVDYNVTVETVNFIKSGSCWKHLNLKRIDKGAING